MTGFFYHPTYLLHDAGFGHPERPERLTAIREHLEKSGLLDRVHVFEPQPADIETLAFVHPRDYIESIERHCAAAWNSHVMLDPDTSVCQHSFSAARLAAGAAMEAADKVSHGELRNAFCAVRPPGHHAERDTAMGFCLFNNVAIAVEWLIRQQRAEKILIIDWDVHHGNGTQHFFYERGDIFYLSLHQWPLYPGTGRADEIGEGLGKGATRNVPLPPATPEHTYLEVFFKTTEEVFAQFRPDFVLISAGFDAHRDDPLANLMLTEAGFGRMTQWAAELANSYCAGRMVSVLEGGYHLTALAASIAAHVEQLLNAAGQ
ncbi:MAG: histone deacetylase [candidate division KSB1 bacterium]|nr:histone deacetylase [candidate division KSB1 bacterium]MDZ7301857.1 histone deacetylase [candidate division KSB1 bacterium]MDZ7310240.1 histone deacetylase [candidate division KSB1 bacterium]